MQLFPSAWQVNLLFKTRTLPKYEAGTFVFKSENNEPHPLGLLMFPTFRTVLFENSISSPVTEMPGPVLVQTVKRKFVIFQCAGDSPTPVFMCLDVELF